MYGYNQRMETKAIALRPPAPAMALPPDEVRTKGWLRAARERLGLSRAEVARRLGVSRASVQDFELGELRGSISLASFRRVALALGCDVLLNLELPADLAMPGPPKRTAAAARSARAGKPEQSIRPAPAPEKSLVWEYREPGT
ncbi:hypothetical protein DB347_04660 [Opitutaceae bacterium EW11]|nr:hypothetical protein DB347_04660 [Opitutaceae bacterium EW11]